VGAAGAAGAAWGGPAAWGGQTWLDAARRIATLLRRHARAPPTLACDACAHTGRAGAGAGAGAGGESLCGACVGALARWVEERRLQAHWLALAMASHPRLGRDSLVGLLDPALIPLIAALCR